MYDRYCLRQSSRHPVHTSAGLMTLETFKESMNTIKAENVIGEKIEVDTTVFREDVYANLINKLNRFLDL